MNVPKLQHGTECINKLDIKQRRVRTMRREVDSSLILHQLHGGVTSSQSHNLSDPQFYYLTQSTNTLDNLNFWGGESKRKERQTCKNYNELTQEEFPSKGRVWTQVQKKGVTWSGKERCYLENLEENDGPGCLVSLSQGWLEIVLFRDKKLV